MIKALALWGIRFYRTAISPYRAPSCRFTPTCSVFAMEAILKHGMGHGVWMTVKRLGKCHPFHAGGFDPVT